MDTNIERYDRQIRLWGQHGQNKCSDARVCLINANSLGTEILKGLCLAGIASFTILDSHKLTNQDIGCIFIPHNSRGKNRGEVVRDMLCHINSDVIGQVQPIEKYLPQNLVDKCDLAHKTREENYICENVNFWKQFNIVIVTGFLHIEQINHLSDICWSIGIPLILTKSIGFYGSMRSQTEEHIVIETHPDNPLPDFGFDQPFKELREYLDSVNLDDRNNLDKVNTFPYIVIIYHYLRKWQQENGYPSTRLPESYQDKSSLRKILNEGLKQIDKMRKERKLNKSDNDVQSSEDTLESQAFLLENFQEAHKAINSCFSVSHNKLPNNVRLLFNHPKLKTMFETKRPNFWAIIAAIKEFYNNQSVLPLSGTIPDMISSSEEYLKVQSFYQKRARDDIEEVFNIVQNIIPQGSNPHVQSLFEETKLLCKNIRDLRMLNTTQLKGEYNFKTMKVKEEYEDDESISIGLGLKAMDIFYSNYSRLPGVEADSVETDISKLKDCLKQMIGIGASKLKSLDQCLYELCRYGGAELHATSAFMGGCVAQEVIKFITNQYQPVDETMIFNALTGSTRTFRFRDAFISSNN